MNKVFGAPPDTDDERSLSDHHIISIPRIEDNIHEVSNISAETVQWCFWSLLEQNGWQNLRWRWNNPLAPHGLKKSVK